MSTDSRQKDRHDVQISQDRRELVRAFAKQNIDGILLIDSNATVVEWNHIMEEVTGLSAGEALGMKAWDVQLSLVADERRTDEAHAYYKKTFLEMLQTGQIPEHIASNESQVYRKDGKQIFAEQKLFVIQTDTENWIGAVVRDTTARKQAEHQIRQQAARAEALATFSQLLTQANQDYQLVLDTVVERCAKLIGDGASVFLYSPESDYLDLAAVYNPNPEAIQIFRQEMQVRPIHVNEGAYGRVITTRQPELIPYIPIRELIEKASPGRREYYQKLPLHSMMLAPLQANGELLGVIGLGRHTPGRSYSPEDFTFLQDMADRSALAMLNARLYHELQQKLTERDALIGELEVKNAQAATLRETSNIVASTLDISEAVQRILQQIKRVIAYDSASVWLYKGKTTHLVGGDGIPDIPEEDKHYTIGENEPDYPLWSQNLPYVLLEDVQEYYPQFREPPINYIRGWLAVPLKVRGELIGIISLDSQKVGQFTHADAQLALNYANQVSIALENARLFSDLEDELAQRQKLIDELDTTNSELAREIEERKRIQEELQKLARTDPLTGLFNRRHFFEIAEKEFAESVRYDRPLSVIILDLDLFKEINDTHGHLVGDQALIHIAELLLKAIRTPDTAARYGGEEFVVLLPETECDNAMLFAERLRKLVEDSPVKKGSDAIHVTASFGVAGQKNKVEETLDQLISKADQALYKAKGNGRNQVVCYRE